MDERFEVLMEEIQMDFDFLTRETMALSEVMLQERSSVLSYPVGPGILYVPEFGGSTFCIRGVSTDSISRTYKELVSGSPRLQKKFKNTEFNLSKISFFETKSFELAETVADQLINRRLLFNEEFVCNISDPGFSWWLDIEQDGFKVYFRSFGVDITESCIKLGPIGDRLVASLRWKQVHDYLSQFISFSEFSIDDASLVIKVDDPKEPHFMKLKELFTFGDSEGLFDELRETPSGKTLYYYFLELETVRSFWLKIEEKLAVHIRSV